MARLYKYDRAPLKACINVKNMHSCFGRGEVSLDMYGEIYYITGEKFWVERFRDWKVELRFSGCLVCGLFLIFTSEKSEKGF